MNASQFIHVICWLVQNSETSIDDFNMRRKLTLQIWPDSKIRVQRWKSAVCDLESRLNFRLVKREDAPDADWKKLLSVADELVLSDAMDRILMAIVSSNSECVEVRNIAEVILASHAETKKRVLEIVAASPIAIKIRTEKFRELFKLTEHVTDLMLSQLPNRVMAKRFAMNKEAFDEFADCAGPYRAEVIRQANVALGLAFSTSIQDLAEPTSDNEDINQKLMDNIGELFAESNFPFASDGNRKLAGV